jgi:hypothetical protein
MKSVTVTFPSYASGSGGPPGMTSLVCATRGNFTLVAHLANKSGWRRCRLPWFSPMYPRSLRAHSTGPYRPPAHAIKRGFDHKAHPARLRRAFHSQPKSERRRESFEPHPCGGWGSDLFSSRRTNQRFETGHTRAQEFGVRSEYSRKKIF